MKVRELIEQLRLLPPEDDVYVREGSIFPETPLATPWKSTPPRILTSGGYRIELEEGR